MVNTSTIRFDEIEEQLSLAPNGRKDLFSDPVFVPLLETRLDRMLKEKKILSLDVFDTLVLRDNSSELTRFFEIGGRMAKIVEAHTGNGVRQVDAFIARWLGTKATYRASRLVHGCREGSLSELHSTASKLLTGSDRLAEAFIEAELAYEVSRISPNPALVSYMERYRKVGGKVVLLTDMYMHAEQVSVLLEKLGVHPTAYDALISSADVKVSKASGKIFSLMEEEMNAGPDDFVHLGDSLRGDVSQPLRHRWQALHLPLSSFDISQRRLDHIKTQTTLTTRYSLSSDIAMPV
ncbi:HAD family hydrolase [Shimia thalassica]|uniref:HAD family hydrolase n=1 Tax=Shimia thalassica TaxID=1715693 RepID=UPI0027359F14|nr:HAD family hydrolase [Shimia thalassica]MDP2520912.1 hypothetical protein [Shimia thalassica]